MLNECRCFSYFTRRKECWHMKKNSITTHTAAAINIELALVTLLAAMKRIFFYAFIVSSTLQKVTTVITPGPPNRYKIKKLSPENIGDFVIRHSHAFHPNDIIGRIKFDTPASNLNCLLSCARHQKCASVNYISTIKLCLLSSSRIFFKTYSGSRVEFFDSIIYYHILKDGKSMYRYPTPVSHGKAPEGCGTNGLNFNTELRAKRIIDGWTPLPYNIPWMGSLVKDSKSICSATLITRKPKDTATVWVLIAAHCIYREYDAIENSVDNDKDVQIDYSRFGFLFGIHDLRLSTPHIVYRTISKIYRHPEPSDLALVKLTKAVRFNAYINALCLPDEPEESDVTHFLRCFTCGWGATKEAALPAAADKLQCTEIEIVEDKEAYTSSRGSLLTIWWKPGPTKGPYRGDSGSPLFCRLMDSAQKFLFGVIVSGTEFPPITTVIERIPHCMEWINGILDRNVPLPELSSQKCCFKFRVIDDMNRRHTMIEHLAGNSKLL